MSYNHTSRFNKREEYKNKFNQEIHLRSIHQKCLILRRFF